MGAPVHGLARHGAKHLAVTVGPNIRFLSPASLQEPAAHPLVCLGRHAPLVSLAVDPTLPFILYAGTADGDVLAFDSRESLPLPGGGDGGLGPAGVDVGGVGGGGGGKKGQRRQLALAFKLGHPRHGGTSHTCC